MTIKRLLIVCLLMGVFLGLSTQELHSQYLTDYLFLTHYENSGRDGESARFRTGDNMHGLVHSNDYITISGRPQFYGLVTTHQDSFILMDGADPIFDHEPMFNVPYVNFLEDRYLENIRANANPWVSTRDGRDMVRVEFGGDDGIRLYRRPLGTGQGDTLFMMVAPIHEGAMFIDGQCEISGQMDGNGNFDNGTVVGIMTIGSAGDMWLIGDIRYDRADRYTGRFGDTPDEMEQMHHMLGLASESNIIIKNNRVNGRGNGAQFEEDQINRHSIIINAALLALGESFTFQHQNNDWDPYQGPSPDERGTIHLTGSVAQMRRGYLHRDNHEGTGYNMDFVYDYRFEDRPPPLLGEDDGWHRINGYHDRLTLRQGSYYVWSGVVRVLTIQAGVEISFCEDHALNVLDSLIILGTSEEPVIFHSYHPGRLLRIISGDLWAQISHTEIEQNIELSMQGDSLFVNNCRFEAPVSFAGNVHIDSCQFAGAVNITGWRNVEVSRSLIRDGIVLRDGIDNCRLINNTIVGSRSAGVRLRRFDSIELVNNIIAYNRYGVVNENRESPVIRYCDTYDNWDGDYQGCEAGQGCITADPMFQDQRRGDYRLQWNSPCVDAGDPESPRDPDGSRCDIGVFYADHELTVADDLYLPEDFTATAAPNPFNRQTTLFVTSDRSDPATVTIYDVQGREVATIRHHLNSGTNRIIVNDNSFTGSGIYFAHIRCGKHSTVVKLVYLP